MTLALEPDALLKTLRGSAKLKQRRPDHKIDLHVIHSCTYGQRFDALFSTYKSKRLSSVYTYIYKILFFLTAVNYEFNLYV